MSKALAPVWVDTHRMHHLLDFIEDLLAVPVGMVKPQWLFQRLLNGHAWVQRRVRVLEDHLHALAVGQELLRAEIVDALAVVANFTL